MHKIFTPFKINKMKLRNRFVRSATVDNLGEGGIVTDAQENLYRNLAKGEIGMIISCGIFPAKDGHAAVGQVGAHNDECIPSLNRLVKVVHEQEGKIAAQILHGGFRCREEISGFQPVGPSPMIDPETGREVRVLTTDDIYGLIESFGQAARRLIEAGFDAIQLHGAHGWLLSAFLSPAMNRREDEWGGSMENRLRFIRMIYEAIRKVAGHDYPLLIKLGINDYHPQGKTLSEGIEIARILENCGMDAIEISEGFEKERGHHIRKDAVHPYYLNECREARKALSLPLILVGGMRKLSDMQAVLDEGTADAVSMCRPFINDPSIVIKFQQSVADSSDCISCNKCGEFMRQRNIHCALVKQDE
jgi:2,4-dienoyl-CoA reductase-like NADH-dependent reductase (Old Yellow Enzyme family)